MKNPRLGAILCIALLLAAVQCTPQPESASSTSARKATPGYYGPLVDSILYHSGIAFKKRQRDNIRFYYEPDPFLAANIDKLMADAIAARDQGVRLLGNRKPSYVMNIIYFNEREDLRPFLDMAPKGYALPDSHTLLIATNDSTRAYHAHEMMHILSINQLGGFPTEPSAWIQEGVAVYADNPCQGYPIHAIAAYLMHTDAMIPMDTLFHRFRELPDMTAYMQAGSVVQFLLERDGLEKFGLLWKNGVDQMGETGIDFEKEYRRFLRQTYPAKPDVNWELLNDKGCG